MELAITDLERTAQMNRRNNPALVNINFKCITTISWDNDFFFFSSVNIKMLQPEVESWIHAEAIFL